MTKLQEEYENQTTRLQGKPQTLYWHDYAKWLEAKFTSYNNDCTVTQPKKELTWDELNIMLRAWRNRKMSTDEILQRIKKDVDIYDRKK